MTKLDRYGAATGELLTSEDASSRTPLKDAYVAHVDRLKSVMPYDEAMESAIGGGFDHVGPIEANILQHYGLPEDGYLIDVGCGSGRLAKPLSATWKGRYLGLDLVPDLVDHARKISNRPDWRFETVDHIDIPEEHETADIVCFFSVLTHLTQEHCYWYLEHAQRVLKSGGLIVFSFLEFQNPDHWGIFKLMLADAKAGVEGPMNVFLGRGFIEVWARHLGMDLVEMRGGNEVIAPAGPLGQSLCVLRKR